MGQWVERATDKASVGIGVLVEANADRIALYITNLTSPVLHIIPTPVRTGSFAGIACPINQSIPFRWRVDGNLARCQWNVTDASGTDEFSIVEELYLET